MSPGADLVHVILHERQTIGGQIASRWLSNGRTVTSRAATATAIAIGFVLLLPEAALAHESQVIRFGSFLGGLTHPVLGLDHFLAMVGVGIVSSMIGGRAIWTVPGLFVAAMAVGALLGRFEGSLSTTVIEVGIALSVVLIGAAIAGEGRVPTAVIAGAVLFFGFFHGYAHGIEIPDVARPAMYALGFLIGTALIHILGVVIGEVAKRYASGTSVLRGLGVAFSATGLLILFGVM
jgi:urease accessory protein